MKTYFLIILSTMTMVISCSKIPTYYCMGRSDFPANQFITLDKANKWFYFLYDKGFHTGSELKTAQDLGVETIVAIPGVPSTSQAPNPLFNHEFFRSNREDDTYTCPGEQALRTNGSWYKEKTSAGNIILFKQYKTKACRKCPQRAECTRSKK